MVSEKQKTEPLITFDLDQAIFHFLAGGIAVIPWYRGEDLIISKIPEADPKSWVRRVPELDP